MNENVFRVLTGMRPTGTLHLGHKVGALDAWVHYQSDPITPYECFFLVADVQALTTHSDRPALIQQSVLDVVYDWLSVGLTPDPSRVHFVLQSQVETRADLSVMLSMLAPWSTVSRNPTVKEELARIEAGENSSVSAGFMLYPVDQAGDIYMVAPRNISGNELVVPVGDDQLPHLELARDLARTFNDLYGVDLFRPCEPRTTDTGRLVGIDGKDKMGKSANNAIMLTDTPEVVAQRVMSMYTDPKRIHATDPGTVEGNPLFIYYDAFAPDKEEVAEYKRLYKLGQIGDVPLKARLAVIINEMLEPIRERRAQAEKEPIGDYLRMGTARASEICREVVKEAQEAMYLGFPS